MKARKHKHLFVFHVLKAFNPQVVWQGNESPSTLYFRGLQDKFQELNGVMHRYAEHDPALPYSRHVGGSGDGFVAPKDKKYTHVPYRDSKLTRVQRLDPTSPSGRFANPGIAKQVWH